MKSQPPADGRTGSAGEIHLARIGDHRWSWRYVESASDIELYCNETFSSREAAIESAGRAYPDVPFAEDDDGE